MSQILSPLGAPAQNPVEGVQNAAARPNAPAGEGIRGLVQNVEVRPAPAPRMAERLTHAEELARLSRTKQNLYTLGRVLLGVVTLGISEIGFGIAHSLHDRPILARRAAVAHANQSLGENVRNGRLAPNFSAAVSEAFTDLRESFGDLVPENATLDSLPSSVRRAVSARVSGLQEEAAPATLRDIVREEAKPFLRTKAVLNALQQAFDAVGYEEEPDLRIDALYKLHPGLETELGICDDRTAVDNVVGAYRSDIEAFAAHLKRKDDAIGAGMEHAVQRFSQELGLSAQEVKQHVNLDKLLGSLVITVDALANGKERPATAEELKQASTAKAESFVEKKLTLLRTAEESPVSEELKAFWKNQALTEKSLNDADIFLNAMRASSDENVEPVESLFAHGAKPDAQAAYGALTELCRGLHGGIMDTYGQQGWAELGGDGQGPARFHAAKALLERMPLMSAALGSAPELLDALDTRADEDIRSDDPATRIAAVQMRFLLHAVSAKNVDSEALAEAVSKPANMPLPFLTALRRAEAEVRAAFPGVELPEDLGKGNIVMGSSVNGELRKAVKDSAITTPAQFYEQARGLMNRCAADALAVDWIRQSAEAAGTPLKVRDVNSVLVSLHKRHPELREIFTESGDAAHVKDALGALGEELNALVAAYQDLDAAWSGGEAYLYRSLSEATGLTEEELRDQFNSTGILQGGGFVYKRADAIDKVNDPNTALAAFPSAEELLREFEGTAERFVSRKGALYQTVDGLPGLSDGYRAELKRAVLRGSELKLPSFFERCSRTAQGMYAAPLLRDLEGGEDDRTLLDGIRRLALQYDSASHITFSPDILNDMGTDETSSILRYSIGMFMDLNPALKNCFAPERGNALMEQVEEDMGRIERELSRTQPGTPAFAQAKARYAQAATMMTLLSHMTQEQG